MKLQVSCNIHFQATDETALILMLRPFRGKQQWINHETYTISPAVQITDNTDSFGNSYQCLIAPIGSFLIQTSAEVIVNHDTEIARKSDFVEIQHLPNEVLCFLLPSRYCESDRFGNLAREVTDDALPGYAQVSKITEWVRNSVQYVPGSSEFPLSAVEVHQRGTGVCRDLAQLAIALCRSISIPARLVVGYLHNLEPMDLHAWFEAYIGNSWFTFDPTQNSPVALRVIIAYGRDAADVSIFHQFGSGCLMNNMDVRVNLLDN